MKEWPDLQNHENVNVLLVLSKEMCQAHERRRGTKGKGLSADLGLGGSTNVRNLEAEIQMVVVFSISNLYKGMYAFGS